MKIKDIEDVDHPAVRMRGEAKVTKVIEPGHVYTDEPNNVRLKVVSIDGDAVQCVSKRIGARGPWKKNPDTTVSTAYVQELTRYV